MDSELEQQRAEQAAYILSHPLVREAFQAIHDSLSVQRKAVKLSDTEGHTRLIVAEQVAHQLETHFHNTIQTGRLSALQVQPTLAQRVFRR